MSHATPVYNLGTVDAPAVDPPERVPDRGAAAAHSSALESIHTPLEAIADSAGLFAPGAGQLLRRSWSDGLFVLSGSAFLVTLGWAIWATLERLPETLSALGLIPHAGLYALGVIWVALAWVHAGNLLWATSRGPSDVHPAIAGCASAVLPGWGQLLNRQPVKASLFVAGLWIVALAWLLGSDWAAQLFASQGVTLRGLSLLGSPAVMWTTPVVLWALAVYDAIAAARR